ncbi:hypothetical protein WICMUC_001329 [Wickerhamomyces mucosus]|uniref:proline--tRNA ligase n=1 Tax=Wickerhamomyces mucosus TaxID=1378264 RepID=A0A9P8THG7_9ASCO|nr:hypothetical protein WICMUC_001329 [Wickerhamomyces mucosus]
MKARNVPNLIQKRFKSSSITNNLIFSNHQLLKVKTLDDIHSYQLLQDLGFIHQSNAGITHWLPLGLKTLRKLTSLIRKRMEEVGFEEFELSSLSNKSLWEKTGRWNNSELYKLKNDDNFCLAPTHEEEITELVRLQNPNYKNLPILTYQISRKYRYEKRPRMGLLRGREFLMKDAYSFDSSYNNAMKTYDLVNSAYYNFFKNDLKLPFEIAKADSGDIGGSMSHEWHFLNERGEDTLFKCDSCGTVSNVEKAVSLPLDDFEFAKEAEVRYLLSKDNETLISCYYPKGRVFSTGYLLEYIEDIDLSTLNLSNEKIFERFQSSEEDLILKKFIRVMDIRINDSTDLPDFPIKVFQKNNFSMVTDLSIVEPIENEICDECEEGKLHSEKAIEVGHTFYLGTKYSAALSAKFFSKDNKPEFFEMGCYGIGISRIIGAIAEISKDSQGFKWPAAISPFEFSLVVAPKVEASNVEDFKLTVNKSLSFNQIENDKISFGNKIRMNKMLGVPIIAIIGKEYPIIELEIRGKRWEQDKLKYEYEKLFELNGEEWNWRFEINENGIEKHFFHKDHFNAIVESLLKDL